MDRGTCWATVPGVPKSSTQLSNNSKKKGQVTIYNIDRNVSVMSINGPDLEALLGGKLPLQTVTQTSPIV